MLKSKLFPRQWKPQDGFAAPRKADLRLERGKAALRKEPEMIAISVLQRSSKTSWSD